MPFHQFSKYEKYVHFVGYFTAIAVLENSILALLLYLLFSV